MLRDAVEVANVFGGVEGLLEVSLWELVTDGVADSIRLEGAVTGSTVDPKFAPVAALAAPAPAPAPAPTLTLLILLLVSLSLLLSLLLVQPLLSKDLL